MGLDTKWTGQYQDAVSGIGSVVFSRGARRSQLLETLILTFLRLPADMVLLAKYVNEPLDGISKAVATAGPRGSTGPTSVSDLASTLTAFLRIHPCQLNYSPLDGLQELQNDEPDQLQAQDHNVRCTRADGSDAGF
jgi:hypothetical protein